VKSKKLIETPPITGCQIVAEIFCEVRTKIAAKSWNPKLIYALPPTAPNRFAMCIEKNSAFPKEN
jgi:hypothetical protein